MRRSIAVLSAALLATGSVAFTNETPPEPTEFTYHLEGTGLADEAHHHSLAGFAPMTIEEPTGSTKSKQISNYAAGPNTQCSGNNLLPTWSGFLGGNGTISGTMDVSIPAIGNGDDVTVAVFADTSGGCNDAYVAPIASGSATLPEGPGTLEATLFLPKGVKPYNLVLMVYADTLTTAQGRVLYGSADFDGTLTFTCTADDEPGVEGELCDVS